MENMDTIVWQNVESSQEGAIFLGKKIQNVFLSESTPFLFLVSGGSCFSVLPNIKNTHYNDVTLAVLDERYDQTNENNNFSQFEKLAWADEFYQKGGKSIATKVLPNETQQELAERFESILKDWLKENPNGKIIALFGMGSDGHTAGIFPEKENKALFIEMFDGKPWIISYDVTGKNPFTKRITLTNTFFQKIDFAFAFICGQDKEKSLKEFMENTKMPNELPVLFLRNLKNINIVTDIKH